MPIITFLIIGTAAGYLATRLMKVNTDIPTTIALGIFGALIGGFVLRLLISVMGLMAGLVGAVLGAMALIWAWQTWGRR
ncbi:GlsB/YeaQ/YmgE family stress response membrane protein [Rhodobacter capsulatus]|uniref:GlsB/YeaQ/YmgE family stress response membrane protein n=1 Tax=Rhodobacter capsulatus TaxID=1061 RepID=A0A4U1K2E7_RHOCA|nr:GlsB/YeaQ/YmgE family stress response membrane protein [Rhodobacter capsulatus]TKD26004.1 GlsB/YeaQ/YmgE family stress response membrane protein [Rhodobacter capsulatus]